MGEEVLSLSTVVDRKTVSITSKKFPKGKLYEFAKVDDLTPYDHAAVVQATQIADALLPVRTRTPKQERELRKALNDALDLIMFTPIETAVKNELTLGQRTTLLMAWARYSREEEPSGGTDGPPTTPPRRTGRGSSRGSRRSTGATPRRGGGSRTGS